MRDQEIVGLWEAYASIYEKKEESEMEKGESENGESENGGSGKPGSGKDEGGKHKEGKHPKGKEEKGEKVTEKGGKEKEKEMKEEMEQLDEISDRRVRGMLAKRGKQDKDSGGISAGYMANRRAQQAAARRNARTGSNVRVDPILSKEETELDEDKAYDRNRKRAAQRAQARNEARARGQTGSVPGVGYVSPRPERATYTDSAGVVRHHTGARMPKNEEVQTDLFDYILEHLVAEGYADTNQAALAIMANMSEEWKQSIVEQMTVTDLDRKLNTPAYQRLMKGNPAYKGGGSGANELQQGPMNRPGNMAKPA